MLLKTLGWPIFVSAGVTVIWYPRRFDTWGTKSPVILYWGVADHHSENNAVSDVIPWGFDSTLYNTIVYETLSQYRHIIIATCIITWTEVTIK